CGQRQSRLFESFDCCLAEPTHPDIRAMREMLPPWLAKGRSARVAHIRNLCFPFAHHIPSGPHCLRALEPLQLVQVVTIRVLETDHAGAPAPSNPTPVARSVE